MKYVNKVNKMWHFGVIFVFLLPFVSWCEQLSFDHLFPQSYYAQVLIGCKKICGDLDIFEPQLLSADEKGLFDDLFLGRLCTVHEAFAAMLKNGNLLLADDLLYLAVVVDQIEHFYKQRLAHGAYEPSPTVVSSLHLLKTKIEALFTQG